MNKIFGQLILIAMLLPASLFSQYENYALKFSQQWSYGSARVQGMGSSYSALGVDYSVVTINPAGLARSTRSAFSVSGGLYTSKINSQFKNTFTESNDVDINVNEISIYKAFKIKDSKWRYAHFGAGFVRHRKFRESYNVKGKSYYTLADDFANRANGYDQNNLINTHSFDSDLAYQTYLIDPDTTNQNNLYESKLYAGDSSEFDVYKQSFGHFSEVNISFAGNYLNKLYIGASIGIPTLKYEEQKEHTENIVPNDSIGIENFTYKENILTRGTGINFKIGAIYLPKEWLRIGLAIHTPSRIIVKEQYTTSMSSKVDQNVYEITDEYRPTGSFEYVVRTPFKANISIAGVIAKRVVLSVEADYLNYGTTKLLSSAKNQFKSSFTFENDIIKSSTKKNAFNARAGLEIRLIKTLALRVGYGYYQSPYNKDNLDQQSDVMTFSGGIGYRMKHFFVDLSYVRRMYTNEIYTIDPALIDVTKMENFKNNITLTLGYRF